MGAVKAATLQTMLETGYDVFISDADVVWFASPWPVVGGRKDIPVRDDTVHLAEADVLASTDCVDYLEDLGPGLVGHEMNTGMLFLRASPGAIAFTKEWQVRAFVLVSGCGCGWCMGDVREVHTPPCVDTFLGPSCV